MAAAAARENTVSNPSMMSMNPMMMGMMGQARYKPYALCLLGAVLKPSAMYAAVNLRLCGRSRPTYESLHTMRMS